MNTKRIALFVFIVLYSSCRTIPHKTPEKQLDENHETLEQIDEAVELVKASDLPQEDKAKIYATLGSSKTSIISSDDTLTTELEIKNTLIFENKQLKKVDTLQRKIIFGFIVENIAILMIVVLLITRWVKTYRLRKIEKAILESKNILKASIEETDNAH